jgi:uncharacterized membrane protein YGL010W
MEPTTIILSVAVRAKGYNYILTRYARTGQCWHTHPLCTSHTHDIPRSGRGSLLFQDVVLADPKKFTNTPALPLPSWLSIPHLPFNLGTFGAFLYSTLYILMEPVAGAMLAPLIIGGTAYGHHLISIYGGRVVNQWAAMINIVSWIAQFVGHGKFEGRAPALLDNLVQALFLAPFFVWFEILFSLGYRQDLKRRLDKAVEEDIRNLNTGKQKA